MLEAVTVGVSIVLILVIPIACAQVIMTSTMRDRAAQRSHAAAAAASPSTPSSVGSPRAFHDFSDSSVVGQASTKAGLVPGPSVRTIFSTVRSLMPSPTALLATAAVAGGTSAATTAVVTPSIVNTAIDTRVASAGGIDSFAASSSNFVGVGDTTFNSTFIALQQAQQASNGKLTTLSHSVEYLLNQIGLVNTTALNNAPDLRSIQALSTALDTLQAQLASVSTKTDGVFTQQTADHSLLTTTQSRVTTLETGATAALTAQQALQTHANSVDVQLSSVQTQLNVLSSSGGNAVSGLGPLVTSIATLNQTSQFQGSALNLLNGQVSSLTSSLNAVTQNTLDATTNANAATTSVATLTSTLATVQTTVTGNTASIQTLTTAQQATNAQVQSIITQQTQQASDFTNAKIPALQTDVNALKTLNVTIFTPAATTTASLLLRANNVDVTLVSTQNQLNMLSAAATANSTSVQLNTLYINNQINTISASINSTNALYSALAQTVSFVNSSVNALSASNVAKTGALIASVNASLSATQLIVASSSAAITALQLQLTSQTSVLQARVDQQNVALQTVNTSTQTQLVQLVQLSSSNTALGVVIDATRSNLTIASSIVSSLQASIASIFAWDLPLGNDRWWVQMHLMDNNGAQTPGLRLIHAVTGATILFPWKFADSFTDSQRLMQYGAFDQTERSMYSFGLRAASGINGDQTSKVSQGCNPLFYMNVYYLFCPIKANWGASEFPAGAWPRFFISKLTKSVNKAPVWQVVSLITVDGYVNKGSTPILPIGYIQSVVPFISHMGQLSVSLTAAPYGGTAGWTDGSSIWYVGGLSSSMTSLTYLTRVSESTSVNPQIPTANQARPVKAHFSHIVPLPFPLAASLDPSFQQFALAKSSWNPTTYQLVDMQGNALSTNIADRTTTSTTRIGPVDVNPACSTSTNTCHITWNSCYLNYKSRKYTNSRVADVSGTGPWTVTLVMMYQYYALAGESCGSGGDFGVEQTWQITDTAVATLTAEIPIATNAVIFGDSLSNTFGKRQYILPTVSSIRAGDIVTWLAQ